MPVYRVVRRTRSVDIIDSYGRCVDSVLDPGGWVGGPQPALEATDSHLVELIEQGERSGRYQPTDFEDHRTYDSTTGAWSSTRWPTPDALASLRKLAARLPVEQPRPGFRYGFGLSLL